MQKSKINAASLKKKSLPFEMRQYFYSFWIKSVFSCTLKSSDLMNTLCEEVVLSTRPEHCNVYPIDTESVVYQ